nr:MAG TPA: hypothetical protein [Caudoviricetes sp.]
MFSFFVDKLLNRCYSVSISCKNTTKDTYEEHVYRVLPDEAQPCGEAGVQEPCSEAGLSSGSPRWTPEGVHQKREGGSIWNCRFQS